MFSTFQKRFDHKRLASVEVAQDDLHKGGIVNNAMFREQLQPLVRGGKLTSTMLRKELNTKLTAAQTGNVARKYSTSLNPYENIVVGKPRLMPNTVMNSREKLKTYG